MTVKEYFNQEGLTLGMLEERAGESSYWETAFNFVNGVYNDDTKKMSVKQGDWLSRIVDDMTEWRIENRASKDAYHDNRV